jgi:hypothetical protein
MRVGQAAGKGLYAEAQPAFRVVDVFFSFV